MARLFFAMLLVVLKLCSAQPSVTDTLGAALGNARKQIRELRHDLNDQVLDQDQFAVLAAREKVYSLYAMRRMTPDQMSSALADRWREVRAGRFAIPPDWSIDGTAISRYGLCVEAALERVSFDEFIAEAKRLIAIDSFVPWFPPREEHKDIFSAIARSQLGAARSRGLNSADAYSAVMAALGDLVFAPREDRMEVMWHAYTGVPVESHEIKAMMMDDLRVVTRDYWLLTIDSVPPHATVTVDSVEWGTAKKGSYVRLGTHTVTLEMSGYKRLEEQFEVTVDPYKNRFAPKLATEPGRKKQ